MPDRTLVVLGAAVWSGGVPSPTLRRRTEWACKLFDEGGYDLLVLSGALGRHPPAEADVMASVALAAGIPRTAMLLDRDAFTTFDTASFAAAMPHAAARDFIAVTDFYHAPRTWLAFRAHGLKIGVSCPPAGRNTHRWRLIVSGLREIPAMLLYALYFIRLRISRS